MDLSKPLELSEDVTERVWTILKIQLSSEPQLLINRVLD